MLSNLIKTLEGFGPLSPEDKAALQRVTGELRQFRAGDEIVSDGAKPSRCALINKGQAFRYKLLSDGRRQIMAFHVPGDMVDLHSLFLSMDHSIGALTNCEVMFIPHGVLETLIEAHPAVGRALWRYNLVESAIFRQWMIGMGRRSAYARIAHLFCEMKVRLEAAGLSHRSRVPLPLTQQHLSDALGLSVVHTNRVLQSLRREGLITFRSGQLVVLDWPGLQAAGEFEAGYLHTGENRPATMAKA